MRLIKSSFNDPFSLGCVCLYLASAINGYILRVDQSNDLEDTKAFDDGRVPHKRTFGGIEEGFEEDVDGGAAGGDGPHCAQGHLPQVRGEVPPPPSGGRTEAPGGEESDPGHAGAAADPIRAPLLAVPDAHHDGDAG